MHKMLSAILKDDRAKVKDLLTAGHDLATRPMDEPKLYSSGIFHWTYVGDTALHLAAPGYRVEIARPKWKMSV